MKVFQCRERKTGGSSGYHRRPCSAFGLTDVAQGHAPFAGTCGLSYSYRKASTGSRREATRAGQTPKKTPDRDRNRECRDNRQAGTSTAGSFN